MIKLGGLVDLKAINEADVYTATSKETGTTSVFKSKDARDAAIKAGTHEKRKDDKDDAVKDPTDKPKVNIFKRDSDKDSKERLKKMKAQQKSSELSSDEKEDLKNRANDIMTYDDIRTIIDDYKDKLSPEQLEVLKQAYDEMEEADHLKYDDESAGNEMFDDAFYKVQDLIQSLDENETTSTRLRDLLSEEETFTAVNKKSGQTSVFKSKASRDAAIKKGTHSKTKEKGDSKKDGKGGVNIFNKDKKEPKSSSSEPDYDKYTSKAQTVTDFIKGDLSTDDIQKIADKNFGKEVATQKELDDFLNNKFIQGMMADTYGVDKEQMVSKVKELKAALFGGEKSEPKSDYTPKVKVRPADKALVKTVDKFSKKLGLSPEKLGKEEYEKHMLSYIHDALEDANFHSANRQIFADLQGRPELAKRPDYSEAPELGSPEREEWEEKNSIYNKAFDASVTEFDDSDEAVGALTSQASWEGEKIIDSLLDKLRKDGSGELADKIQMSFDKDMAKNEGKSKLGDLL